MLKLALAVLTVALAGTASAAGWRSLRVDASSDTAFEQSLALFKEKLSPARRHVFGEALKDIWVKGSQAAEAEQGEYTASDYYRQLDGLDYEQVVKFTDPSGDTARERRRQAARAPYTRSAPYSAGPTWDTRSPFPSPAERGDLGGPPATGWSGENMRGRTPLFGPGPPP